MANGEGRAARSAAWGAVAVVFGAVAVAGLNASLGPAASVPFWACSLVAAVGLYMCFATAFGFYPANRCRRRKLSKPMPWGNNPVQVALGQQKWDAWGGSYSIGELEFTITNTSPYLITLVEFNLASDPSDGDRPPLDEFQARGLSREVQRRRDVYRSLILRPVELAEGESVSGWWVQAVDLPPGAKAGRPPCVFTITDVLGNTWEVKIPSWEPQVWRIDLGG